jgi:ATP-dependent RNA helicase DeaD
VVEPLAEEFDLVDIALAAVSLAEGADARDEDEADLPQAALPTDRQERRPPPGQRPPRGAPRGGAPGRGPRALPRGRPDRGARDDRDGSSGWVRLWVGGGRRAGIRPGDLVGAITNEAGVGGSAVGAIQIADGFSLVDVDEAHAEEIVHALRAATIKGRRLTVRPDRASGPD